MAKGYPPPFHTRDGAILPRHSARIVSGKLALEFTADGKKRMICGDITSKKGVSFTPGFEKVPEYLRTPAKKINVGKSTLSVQLGMKTPKSMAKLIEPKLEMDLTANEKD